MRSHDEIFEHHAAAVIAGDIDEIMVDYADDAVWIHGTQLLRGRAALEEMFRDVPPGAVPSDFSTDLRVDEGDHLFVSYRIGNLVGGDTFYFQDDKIKLQIIHVVEV
jgi:ketosteroid isomerase-like protein